MCMYIIILFDKGCFHYVGMEKDENRAKQIAEAVYKTVFVKFRSRGIYNACGNYLIGSPDKFVVVIETDMDEIEDEIKGSSDDGFYL